MPSNNDSVFLKPDKGTPIINLTGLKKSFLGKEPVLNQLDMQVFSREFIFLTGVSGAGKTTLLKILIGLETADEGKVLVNGRDISQLNPRLIPFHRRSIGMVYQDYKLLSSKTVYYNIALPLMIAGFSGGKLKNKVLNIARECMVEPFLDQRVVTLSGGEQQLVAIARAASTRPNIILADEPTANLDRSMADKIIDLLNRFQEKGTTVIVSTHDIDLIRSAGKKILLIKNAGLVEINPDQNIS